MDTIEPFKTELPHKFFGKAVRVILKPLRATMALSLMAFSFCQSIHTAVVFTYKN